MIWFILFGFLALFGLYLMAPFLRPQSEPPVEVIEQAKAQRATLELDEAEGRLSAQAAAEARDALDRRILALLDAEPPASDAQQLRNLALGIVPAAFLLGAVGIYAQVGSPGYERISLAEFQAEQAAQLPDSLEGIVVELSARLEADPNPPVDGYVLLARSYARLGQIENMLAAYDRAISFSGGAPDLIEERDRVVQMLRDRSAAPEIDPAMRAQIEAMSAEEQAAMIENMVSGLAVRLEQDPRDIQGWLRLIRARAVMGDLQQAQRDLDTARDVFGPESPEAEALETLAADLFPTVGAAPE